MTQTAVYLGANYSDIASSHDSSFLLKKFIIVESFEFKEAGELSAHLDINYFDNPTNSNHLNWPKQNNRLISPQIVSTIMNDKNLSLLWERCPALFRYKYFNGIARYNKQINIIISALNFLNFHKIDTFVFSYEPHNLWIYLLKQAALAINCKTVILSPSPIPWKLFASSQSSLSGESSLLSPNIGCVSKCDSSIKRFINEKVSSYSLAKPFYEKKRYIKSLKFKRNIHSQAIKYLSNLAIKNKINHLYTKREDFLSKPYIAFYLSYQPESTTLPNGDFFVSMDSAIRFISEYCSINNILLVVREHPSTFRWGVDFKWRPLNFYKSILSISNNIILDSVESDPYELMENSLAVASVSGSILVESALNNKPIIALGKHQLKNFEHPQFLDLHVKNYNLVFLHEFLSRGIESQSNLSLSDAFIQYLMNLYRISFGTNQEYVGNAKMNRNILKSYRRTSLLNLLHSFIVDV